MSRIDEDISSGVSRRTFLKGVGGVLAATPLMNVLAGEALAVSPEAVRHHAAQGSGTRLVLLGTTGGVSWWPKTTRASSSSAIVVGETIYLVDLGQGSTSRLSEAFNTEPIVKGNRYCGTGSSTFLRNVKALFFTHIHKLNSHTPVEKVGAVAETCGVKTLVLNHIVPGVMPMLHLQRAHKGFSGKLIVGSDLMQIRVEGRRGMLRNP